MRLKYIIGFLATMLLTACSIDVDLEEPVEEASYHVQITYGYSMPTLACRIIGLSSVSKTGTYPNEVGFTAKQNSPNLFECDVNLPASLPSSAQLVTDLDGKSYPITAGSDKIIKINK